MTYSDTARVADVGSDLLGSSRWLLVTRELESNSSLTIGTIVAAVRGYMWVAGIASFLCCCAIAYVLLVPKIYESSLVVSVIDGAGNNAPGRSGVVTLSSVAGLSLTCDPHRSEYVSLLSSRHVASRFLGDRWDTVERRWKSRFLHPNPLP